MQPDDLNGETEVYEVQLPTGGVIGHRQYYQTVYKQNLGSYLREAVERNKNRALAGGTHESALAKYADPWGNLVAASAHPAGFTRVLARDQLERKRVVDKYNLNLGMHGNFFLRGHLRRQY